MISYFVPILPPRRCGFHRSRVATRTPTASKARNVGPRTLPPQGIYIISTAQLPYPSHLHPRCPRESPDHENHHPSITPPGCWSVSNHLPSTRHLHKRIPLYRVALHLALALRHTIPHALCRRGGGEITHDPASSGLSKNTT
ncbi:hypothetical protein VTI74DRAFT_1596 [Chaetomium olivicolor]